MLVISLQAQIEAALADPNIKHASGNVQSFKELFKKENIMLLEEKHDGLFAYLAFHPDVDRPIVDYIQAGSLSDDSGEQMLVFFTLKTKAHTPKQLTSSSMTNWLQVDNAVHPAYQVIRMLFPDEAVALPGIAIFDQFSKPDRAAVYVSLQGLEDADKVRASLRTIFALANKSLKDTKANGKSFEDEFAVLLKKNKIAYNKSGKKTLLEWFIGAYQYIDANKGDLVSFIRLFRP